MQGKRSFLWTLTSVLLIAALALPWAVLADNYQVDNDTASGGNQNIVNITASPGATVNTSGQVVVEYQGSKHLVAGSSLVFSVNTAATTLPTGYVVSSINLTVPNPWTTGGQFNGSASVSFTAPSTPGSYSYNVKWEPTTFTCVQSGCLTGGAALVINLTVESTTNQPPTAAFSWFAVSPDEGDEVAFTDESTDSDGSVVAWSWDFGDGVGTSTDQNPSYTYMDDGTYTVCLTVTDDDGADSEEVCHDVVVADLAPTAAFTWAPETQDEGSPVDFTDESTSYRDDIISWAWDFDDGDTSDAQSPEHTFMDDGVYNVCLTVTDDDDSTDTVCHDVTINNVAPTATFNYPTANVNEGSSFALSLTDPYDPSSVDTAAGFEYAFDCGSGYGAWGTSSSVNCATDDNAILSVAGKIRDKDGGFTEYTGSVTVVNVAPTATFNYPTANVNEGSSFTLSLTNPYDPSSVDTTAGFEYAFDCGSGYGAWGTSNSATCLTCDNAIRSVAGKIRDKDGGVTEYTGSVTVVNVAPSITSVSAPVDPVNILNPVNVSVSFSDVGTCDTHSVVFAWGDGTSTTVNPATSPASASHIYPEAAVYEITITVTDDDGGSVSTTVMVVVYDPSAGFVTGGGWINSPAGAYTPDASLGGKATFGFVSKYLKGATVPSGNTQFVFHAAGMSFHSSSYEWLVVNQAGTNAQYKGFGSVNGVPGYQFMLWATDGGKTGVDTFRIKIWMGDYVLYDNGVAQEIASGSIVIHTGKK